MARKICLSRNEVLKQIETASEKYGEENYPTRQEREHVGEMQAVDLSIAFEEGIKWYVEFCKTYSGI